MGRALGPRPNGGGAVQVFALTQDAAGQAVHFPLLKHISPGDRDAHRSASTQGWCVWGGRGPQNYGSAGEERRVGKLTRAGKWQQGHWAMAEVVCDAFGIACRPDIGGRTRGQGLLGTRVKTFLGFLGLAGFKLVIG